MSLNIALENQTELLKRGFSRRSFGRIASLITAGAALPFYNEPALAQLSYRGDMPPDTVMINANENPMGPCPEAADAIHSIVAKGGRYLYGETFKLDKILAEQEGVKPSYVMAFAGSSDPLHRSVLSYASKDKPLIVGDPGYEAAARAAHFVGAKVIQVPLTKTYAHDVRAMIAASPTPGLFYICNPNNPTGTLTSKEDIEYLVANKPAGSVVLLDEAYIHISNAPMSSYLVAQDKDVIILRTFSKLYGMAGLRAGAAIGRPDLLEPLLKWSAGANPITGMIAASTSLQVKGLVPQRRKIIGDIREDTFAFLAKNNVTFIPAETNCFMVDVKRPGKQFQDAMLKEKVAIGRVWPIMPNYVRITVGTKDEMAKFKSAFLKCYNA
jgi:histidinol-phosphate aminotransferase